MTTRDQARVWIVGALLAIAGLYVLREIMLPFVAGMAVAYFLDPVADRLERLGLSRTVSTSLITGAFFVLMIVLVLLLAPVIHHQLTGYLARLPGYLDRAREALQPLLALLAEQAGADSAAGLKGAVSEYAQKSLGWLGGLLSNLWSGGFIIFNIVSLLFITPIVAFYLLRDWDVLVARVDGWLPRSHASAIRSLLAEVDRVLAGFVRGQATVCLILATYYGIALTITGLEFGLVIGVISGLVSFVPFVGALFGFVAAMGVAGVQYWPQFLPMSAVLAVFVVGQVLEGHLLTPRLVGRRVGLHPVWVIFGLLAGSAVFGFVGILLAVPVTAVAGVAIRFFLQRYLASAYYHGGETPAANPSLDLIAEKTTQGTGDRA